MVTVIERLKKHKLLILGGGIILLILITKFSGMFWAGGWETTIAPKTAYERNLQKTKSLAYVSWQTGFDFDTQYYGAPDLWIQVMSWTHTSGRLDPTTGYYEKTEWADYAKRFQLSYKETLPQPDGSKIDKVVIQEYDLHLFWTLVQIGTAADAKKVDEDRLGNHQYHHETSCTEVTHQGDLGNPTQVDVTLEADITPWPLRSVVDDYQKAGIMNIQALPYPFYREGQVAQSAAGEDAWKERTEENPDLDYDTTPRGHMVARGMPQSGVYDMRWPDQTPWTRREITSEEEVAQLPTALPEKLLVTPRVWLRCGYVLGKSRGLLYNAVEALIPVDLYVQFGLLMEVLTVAEHVLYSDPYGITLTMPTKYDKYTPEPGPWDRLGEFFKGLAGLFDWFPGGWKGLVVIVILAAIGIVLAPHIITLRKGRRMVQ